MEFKLIQKKIFLLLICFFVLTSCVSFIGKEYKSSKKFPNQLPNYILKFENEERGQIIELENDTKNCRKEKFAYKRKKKLLMISLVSDSILLKKNDTLVYYRSKLYFFTKKYKIVFEEMEKTNRNSSKR